MKRMKKILAMLLTVMLVAAQGLTCVSADITGETGVGGTTISESNENSGSDESNENSGSDESNENSGSDESNENSGSDESNENSGSDESNGNSGSDESNENSGSDETDENSGSDDDDESGEDKEAGAENFDLAAALSVGGEVALTTDVTLSADESIEITTETSLDLNGHQITIEESESNGAVITVKNGAKFVLKDSDLEGKGAITGGNRNVICIREGCSFVMESGDVTNVSGASAVKVDGTNVAVEFLGGAITNCGGNEVKGGAVYVPWSAYPATVTIDGTEFLNNTAGDGGAICAAGTTLTIKSGLFRGNKAHKGGAIYVFGNRSNAETTVIMEGGEIDGNEADVSGGGIYATEQVTVRLEDGTISGNKANANESNAGGYWAGGGGICTDSSDNVLIIAGGKVSENYSRKGGGGLRTKGTLIMQGGEIINNVAFDAEGGGISINNGTAVLFAGRIAGNKSGQTNDGVFNDNYQHWGGGGVFCADSAELQICNARITGNKADGFGGGVAGCSTGRLFLFDGEGAAVYGNTAFDPAYAGGETPHLSGGASAKNEDHTYAAASEVFMQNGYADVFCALNGTVQNKMLGVNANWQGSIDGRTVDAYDQAEDSLTAAYLIGLTAGVDASAFEGCNFTLVIEDNYSYTHGGGILCNGYLFSGKSDNTTLSINSRLSVSGTKALYDTEAETYVDLTGHSYSFGIYEVGEDGKVASEPVARGTSGDDGTITFDSALPFKAAGTYTYLLVEEDTDDVYDGRTVEKDSKKYLFTVTVEKKDITEVRFDENLIYDIDQYDITGVEVQVSTDGIQWDAAQSEYVQANESHADLLKITGDDAAFTNKVGKKVEKPEETPIPGNPGNDTPITNIPTTDVPETDVPTTDVPETDDPAGNDPLDEVVLIDEDVPLDAADPEDEDVTELTDEDVPLSDNPKTGDSLPIFWMISAAAAALGLLGAGKRSKSKL